MAVLTVATCQFPVSANIDDNVRYVLRQMDAASRGGARVAHFPEGSLSGYAGTDFETFAGFEWSRLQDATARVAERACQHGMWAVLGSAHRLTGDHKPHNSVYVISDSGQIVERYDKRFCSSGDLEHYSPGSHFSVWDIDGVRCGSLICYDYRYPELYRHYKKLGVEVVFHCNYMWISAANSSARESAWPAFFVRADGITTGRLRRNVAGVLISAVDTEADLYDSTGPWRERALAGVLHSGELLSDSRSDRRTGLGADS